MAAMKRRSIAIIVIAAFLLAAFSSLAVYAAEDDHGADAHSESMYEVEDEVADENELSFVDEIISAVTTYIPYVLGVICGVVVLVIIIKIIKRGRKPKYTGKH